MKDAENKPAQIPADALDRAEKCGRAQLDLAQAARVVGVDVDTMRRGGLAEAYLKGRADGLMAVRHALLKRAAEGDVAAIKEYLDCQEASEPTPVARNDKAPTGRRKVNTL